MYGRRLVNENKFCCVCLQDPVYESPAKLYIRKEHVLVEKYIADFHTMLYIIAIQNLLFHRPKIFVLGTYHFGNTHRKEFKRRRVFQNVFYHCDYAERVFASFAHQIQSEYYGGNKYVSIKGIALEHFSAKKIQKRQQHHNHAHVMM